MIRRFVVPLPADFDMDTDPSSLIGREVTQYDDRGVGTWLAERVEINPVLHTITIWVRDDPSDPDPNEIREATDDD